MTWRAVVAILLVCLAGCGAVTDAGTDGAGGADSSAVAGGTLTPAPIPTDADLSAAPPPVPAGLTDSSIQSTWQLGRNHRRALQGRSYVWVEEHDSRRRSERGVATWVRRTERMVVESGTVYRRDLTRVRGESLDGFDWYNHSTYANGSVWFTREQQFGRVVYDSGTVRDQRDTYAYGASFALRQYLAPGNATVSIVTRDGQPRYRVETTDRGRYMQHWRNYSAVALIEPSGLVRQFRVSYAIESSDGIEYITYGFRYERVGNASVRRPAWVDAATERPGE